MSKFKARFLLTIDIVKNNTMLCLVSSQRLLDPVAYSELQHSALCILRVDHRGILPKLWPALLHLDGREVPITRDKPSK